ncbi:uncharacterized protein B0P05DRAFT_553521 [Gilbertella persicaria]|uniref:uncharacterized protein n=1 Tax=Gilbertella persicaria TaxID=101096 RepID=UPI00221FCA5B|nr:uncharacterized protein B0P05DRAFT_553521 [Gilbertella persicaria]KAI8066239.1 hypothetical protein B0P05DRAFT_553521 [Gilbertella persicaria]
METDQAIKKVFSKIPNELYLLTAVELVNDVSSDSSQQDNELAKQALRFLRIQAAKGDIEAKIKLSTILDKQDTEDSVVKGDLKEAILWARSVFDRRLSKALAPCVSEIILLAEQEHNGSNLIERILARTKVSKELDDKTVKKEQKLQKHLSYLAGILFMDGTGVDRDITRGMDYLSKASEIGHEGAGVELAKILSDPFKYPKQYNMEKSLAIYESVVEKQQRTTSDARALTDLARVYYEGSDTIPRDIEKAYTYARRVAESVGEQFCQFIVGDVLLNPPTLFVSQDVRQAVFWLTQSAEQGFPLAIETLSRIYYEGQVKGIKKDYEQARHWCLIGDDIWPSGLGYCQTCLGDMYRQGLGVPKDLFRSFEYYQKAASQQDAPQNYARYMLGEM